MWHVKRERWQYESCHLRSYFLTYDLTPPILSEGGGGGALAVTVLECSLIRIEMYEFFFLCYHYFFWGENPHKGRKKFLNWKVSVLNNAIVRTCNKIQIARMREVHTASSVYREFVEKLDM